MPAVQAQAAVLRETRDAMTAAVWMVRDPATCPASPCPGDVLATFATQAEASQFTARLPRRVLVIEKWTVPGHE
jgi:hypothetical protein